MEEFTGFRLGPNVNKEIHTLKVNSFCKLLNLCGNNPFFSHDNSDLLEEENKTSEPAAIHKAKDFFKGCVDESM